MIHNGDSLEVLRGFETDTVDAVITDPPYGYSFMGKDWDKAVPSVEIWRECLRALKPGGWCMVMSAPRSDVQNAMISRLMEAGFRLDFTPIYWTYASGFPKAGNVGKLVDKRLGAEREVLGHNPNGRPNTHNQQLNTYAKRVDNFLTEPSTDQAKALDGSYTGFQPKPAVEVVIVAMKPLSEKTYVDQALKNGKGITWLDDARIPTTETLNGSGTPPMKMEGNHRPFHDTAEPIDWKQKAGGRFPANLLVEDNVLGEHSKYFNLDEWTVTPKGIKQFGASESNPITTNPPADAYEHMEAVIEAMSNERTSDEQERTQRNEDHEDADNSDNATGDRTVLPELATLPFLITPKASKSEKNKGLDSFEVKQSAGGGGGIGDYKDDVNSASGKYGSEKAPSKNHHPTVKPLKLMSYLITLTTRPGDTVLDPFVGSGTTVVAAKQLDRIGIGIEREAEYAEIAKARVEATIKVEPEEDKQLSFV